MNTVTQLPCPTHPNRPEAGRGFSLVELLVVIAIISLLIGVTIPAARYILDRGDANKMKAVLAALEAGAEEYEIQTESVIDHRSAGSVTLTDGNASGTAANVVVGDDDLTDGDADNTIGLFLAKAMLVPSAQKVILTGATKASDLVTPEQALAVDPANPDSATINDVTVVDFWGNKIRYAAKVDYSDSTTDDDYLPAHPSPFFASAGPDGLWGSHDTNTNQPDADAVDNIYSFDLDR